VKNRRAFAIEPTELPKLIRRRQIWLPTLWGALLLCGIAAVALLVAARNLGGYLAHSDLARAGDGRGAPTLVVEGWLDERELDAAIATLRRGGYQRVVTSGGPIEGWHEGVVWPNYAERAASYLRRHGVVEIPVVAVAAPATARERTFLSAVVVRDWLRREQPGVDAIDLVSAGVHARRSRLAYRMAFGSSVDVGVIATTPRSYDIDHWWRTSEGAKTVLGELLSLAWTKCCFWPGADSSPEGSAQVPKTAP
jgi:hypothetical protein